MTKSSPWSAGSSETSGGAGRSVVSLAEPGRAGLELFDVLRICGRVGLGIGRTGTCIPLAAATGVLARGVLFSEWASVRELLRLRMEEPRDKVLDNACPSINEFCDNRVVFV